MRRRILIAIAFAAAVVVGASVVLLRGPASGFRGAPEIRSAPATRNEPGREPAGGAAESVEPALRYDREYPGLPYSTGRLSGRLARLSEGIENGSIRLEFEPPRGYLDSLLRALEIDPSSQMLVFSKTSLQVADIGPKTPRAIYFNDDTYVAWVQGAATIEIASMDPALGPVFHTLVQDASAPAGPERELLRCLRCHDSYSLTGGGVPRFILGSGYIGTNGEIVSHEAWILTHPSTPIESRWGGWYVTGRQGDDAHLGNIVVGDVADLQDLDSLRIGNVDDVSGLIDSGPYLTAYSDIVALLVIEDQIDIQNAISRVLFDTTTLLDRADPGEDVTSAVAEIAEPLVRALFMVDDVPLDGIAGTSGFTDHFQARGPRDSNGRSLRDLDLTTRLFRYPLSYLIYSEAFNGLPRQAREYVAARIGDILNGRDSSPEFANLSSEDRRAILEILRETKPGFLDSGSR